MSGFAKELETFLFEVKKGTPELVLQVQKKIAFDILNGVVYGTPVDTGRARGGWQVTVGETPNYDTDVLDEKGYSVIEKGGYVIESLLDFDIIYITNNVPYILFLEDGWSKQAPEGFVEMTFDRIVGNFSSFRAKP